MSNPSIQSFNNFVKAICPLITDTEVERVASKLSVRELKKKEYFIHAGELQKELGFIYKGLIRSFYVDRDENDQTMRFMAEMDFVSNYAAFLSNRPSMYNFQCLEDTVLLFYLLK